jgi:phosphoenolpyruvate carboxylase
MASLTKEDIAIVREAYPSLDSDLAGGFEFTNEHRLRHLFGNKYSKKVGAFMGNRNRVHEELTTAIWSGVDDDPRTNASHYIEEASHVRRFLG